MNNLQITFWGGVGSVTGANFLLEDSKTRILVDCGLLQGVPEAGIENSSSFPYDPKAIDFLFITHAHMDHIGKIGKLVRDGFRGTIYSTPETKELAHVMILDALKVMEMNAQNKSLSEAKKPLYEIGDVNTAMSIWKTISYHVSTDFAPDFSVKLLDAGHILGSSMYEFLHKDRKIVFTGDSGNSPSPLLRPTEAILDADYVVMDSVYGDRNHEPKAERDARFQSIIKETIAKDGTLVIPAFSLERTQVILYELNNLIEEGKISQIPVFLDSPLGLKVTDIYKHFSKDFNTGVQGEIRRGDDIFSFPKLRITHGVRDSRDIEWTKGAKIIIAGSGMSAGGRVVYHEAQYLPDLKNTILLMGYQAVGTLGRDIQNKPKEVMIDGQNISVHARIEMISGYSSHKDSNGLVDMIENTAKTVKKVFVVMGEPSASLHLTQRLRDELDVNAVYPDRGIPYVLQ